MDRKTFLFLNSIDRTVWGGLEHWMELCAVGLARRGHRLLMAGRPDSHFLRRLSRHTELSLHPISLSSDFSWRAVRRLRRIFREYQVDAVVGNFVRDIRLAGLARWPGRRPVIVWSPGVNLAKRRLSHKWFFTDFVDAVVIPSDHLRREIAASGYIDDGLFEVIPVGLDEKAWSGNREEGRQFVSARYNFPESAFLCVTSGRFVPQKGHEHLVDAARRLFEKYPNIYFLLLGDGPLQATLLEKIRQAGLTEHFVLCGMLENHQRVIFGADLCVHPAVIEPFGIVLVEAMAASLPVVASRVGGIPEVVEDGKTALLVDPGDSEGLAAAIERLYLDRPLRRELGQAGRKRFDDRFRLETMINRIENFLIGVAEHAHVAA